MWRVVAGRHCSAVVLEAGYSGPMLDGRGALYGDARYRLNASALGRAVVPQDQGDDDGAVAVFVGTLMVFFSPAWALRKSPVAEFVIHQRQHVRVEAKGYPPRARFCLQYSVEHEF